MVILNNRIEKYDCLSNELASLSDQRLKNLFEKAVFNHSGIGGRSAYLTIGKVSVFVKKVPLTELEMRVENVRSTANLFDLPLYYQYGVGSAGFGAWRELTAHIMTTNWALTEKCPNFPLMYHWRVLKGSHPVPMSSQQIERLEQDIKYWNGSLAVRKRLEQIHNSSAYILLFLEYIPCTLYHWLSSQLTLEEKKAKQAISFVEKELKNINRFLKAQDFLHFDAHFENILTDGKALYFSDFGLSLSRAFNLSKKEIEFFNNHINFDECCAAVNLMHCLIANLEGKDKWPVALEQLIKEEDCISKPPFSSIIKRYGQIALIMDDFFMRLQKENKRTVYPKEHLDNLLRLQSLMYPLAIV